MYQAYDPCPCGSGKKFKWCCQEIYPAIEKACGLNRNRQHDAAISMLQDLARRHPQNAEVWGQLAGVLAANQRMDEAELALDKALQANYRYARGYYLRGSFRHHEGEYAGALLLFRKALDLVQPDQRILASEIALMIFECELRRQRVLAAEAALSLVETLSPHLDHLAEVRERHFGPESGLPRFMRDRRRLLPPPATLPREAGARWQAALGLTQMGKFSQAEAVLVELENQVGSTGEIHYNLALCRIWSGDYRGALEALNTYVQVEVDESKAADAWMLAESLRLSLGMEEVTDHILHVVKYPVVDLQALLRWCEDSKRLVDVTEQPYGMTGVILDREPVTRGDQAFYELPRTAATMVVTARALELSGPSMPLLMAVRKQIEGDLGPALGPPQTAKAAYDVGLLSTMFLSFRIPTATSEAVAKNYLRQSILQFFESQWMNRSLVSLDRQTPVEAVRHPLGRKKVLGLLRFWQEVQNILDSDTSLIDRQRALLGLPTADPNFKLDAEPLVTTDGSEDGDTVFLRQFQEALQQGQHDQAEKLAKALLALPAKSDGADRFPAYRFMAERMRAARDFAAALEYIDAGEKTDREHHGGRRAGTFTVQRAACYLANDEPGTALEVLSTLLQSTEANLESIGQAVELLLRHQQREAAGRYAQAGLRQAESVGDRDRVEYFRELSAAANKT